MDFKIRNHPTDKNEYFGNTKGSVHQEDMATINIYAVNNQIPKYIKPKLTYEKIKSLIIILGDFNTVLSKT